MLPAALPGHVAYLDGWRGLCILLVLIGHFFEVLRPVGAVGVEFFFALSGRLMAEVLIVRQMPIGRFLQRRASRILPGLIFYIVSVSLVLTVPLALASVDVQMASPIAALLLVHNFLPQDQVSSLFEHTWSLAVEEHSYLLLAVIAVATARRPVLAVIAALLVCGLCYARGSYLANVTLDYGQYAVWRSDVRAASVLLPFALTLAADRLTLRLPSWTAPACATVAISSALYFGYLSSVNFIAVSFCATGAVLMLGQTRGLVRRLLENRILVVLGTISFSLYLWQQLFFSFAKEAHIPPLLVAPLALAYALWSYKRIEQPARNYLNSRWDRSRVRDPAPSSQELPAGV
jgi:peptidoglycan/LPS O-acetylase OafA/YrhL